MPPCRRQSVLSLQAGGRGGQADQVHHLPPEHPLLLLQTAAEGATKGTVGRSQILNKKMADHFESISMRCDDYAKCLH